MNIGAEGTATSGSVALDSSSAANTAGNQRGPLMISSASARPALGLHGVMLIPCWASIKESRSSVRYRAIYATDRPRTVQTRPVGDLGGAAHAGIGVRPLAAPSAIIVSHPG